MRIPPRSEERRTKPWSRPMASDACLTSWNSTNATGDPPLLCILSRLKPWKLLNKSLSSCSEENCPKLATNRVEQGELLVWAAMDTPGLWEDVCWTCSVPAPAVLTLVLRGLVRMGVAAIGGCGRAADTAWGEATMVGWWIWGRVWNVHSGTWARAGCCMRAWWWRAAVGAANSGYAARGCGAHVSVAPGKKAALSSCPVIGWISVGWVAAGCGLCCLGLVTFVLLFANSNLNVCGKSGSNLTPCKSCLAASAALLELKVTNPTGEVFLPFLFVTFNREPSYPL